MNNKRDLFVSVSGKVPVKSIGIGYRWRQRLGYCDPDGFRADGTNLNAPFWYINNWLNAVRSRYQVEKVNGYTYIIVDQRI